MPKKEKIWISPWAVAKAIVRAPEIVFQTYVYSAYQDIILPPYYVKIVDNIKNKANLSEPINLCIEYYKLKES